MGLTGSFGLLQGAGNNVASWFINQDRPDFEVTSTIASTLILATILCLLLVYGKFLVGYWRSGDNT
jgi:hypothetical protein